MPITIERKYKKATKYVVEFDANTLEHPKHRPRGRFVEFFLSALMSKVRFATLFEENFLAVNALNADTYLVTKAIPAKPHLKCRPS